MLIVLNIPLKRKGEKVALICKERSNIDEPIVSWFSGDWR
jgi:hypothetical protein